MISILAPYNKKAGMLLFETSRLQVSLTGNDYHMPGASFALGSGIDAIVVSKRDVNDSTLIRVIGRIFTLRCWLAALLAVERAMDSSFSR